MKKAWIVLLMGVALSPIAQSQEVVRQWDAQAALDVNSAGQVANVTLLQEFPEAIAKPAREVMTHWRFKPVLKDGHAVGARTYVFVKLEVVRRDQATFGLEVLYGSNGPRLRPTISPFPEPGEVLATSGGAMLIEAVVRPDGHIDQVHVVESHFANQPHLFSQSAAQAVKQWLADPEYVDGTAVATRIQIPITLCSIPKKNCGNYRSQLKSWHPRVSLDAPLSPDTDQSVALNSPLEPLSVQPGG